MNLPPPRVRTLYNVCSLPFMSFHFAFIIFPIFTALLYFHHALPCQVKKSAMRTRDNQDEKKAAISFSPYVYCAHFAIRAILHSCARFNSDFAGR
jgi:hypothetical protein